MSLPFSLLLLACVSLSDPPAPVGVLPTARQRAWIDMRLACNLTLPEEGLSASEADCPQWARVAREAGFGAVFLSSTAEIDEALMARMAVACAAEGVIFGLPGLDAPGEDGRGSTALFRELSSFARAGSTRVDQALDDHAAVLKLVERWYASVGLGGTLRFDLDVASDGRIAKRDVERLQGMREALDRAFDGDHARGRSIQASQSRGGGEPAFAPELAVDGDARTYWAADDTVRSADLTIELEPEQRVDKVLLSEAIELGARIVRFEIDVRVGEEWRKVATGRRVGARRVLRFEPLNANALRVRILGARAAPILSAVEVYAPAPIPSVSWKPALQFFREPRPGLNVRIHPGDWSNIDDFLRAEPASLVVFDSPTPQARAEHGACGLVFAGYLSIPTSGVHFFQLAGADGARLWIDAEVVAESGTPRGAIGLEAGWHRFELAWFDAGEAGDCRLAWSGPGFGQREISEDGTAFGH